MNAIRRFFNRMLREHEESRISSESITVRSTFHGATELDAEELYQSPPVRSFVERATKTRKA
jgi:hypothetical protein